MKKLARTTWIFRYLLLALTALCGRSGDLARIHTEPLRHLALESG